MASIVITLLLGVLVIINKVQAAIVNITLNVTAWEFSCSQYPTQVNMWSSPAWWFTVFLTGDLWNSWFVCTDLLSIWSTQLTISTSDLSGDTNGKISASNINLVPTGSIIQTAGDCDGLSLGTGGTLNLIRTIIKKTGIKTCGFSYMPDGMSVTIPAWSPVNRYTATMTITPPS